MPTDIEGLTGLEHGEFMDVLSDYLYESIGAPEFGRQHPLIEKACVVVPSTAHISFTKAVTILGMGKNSLVPVAVDEDSRMDSSGKRTQFRHLMRVCVTRVPAFCVFHQLIPFIPPYLLGPRQSPLKYFPRHL